MRQKNPFPEDVKIRAFLLKWGEINAKCRMLNAKFKDGKGPRSSVVVKTAGLPGGGAAARNVAHREVRPTRTPVSPGGYRSVTPGNGDVLEEGCLVRGQLLLQGKVEKNGSSPKTWYRGFFQIGKFEPSENQNDPAENKRNRSLKFLQFLENFSGVYPPGGEGGMLAPSPVRYGGLPKCHMIYNLTGVWAAQRLSKSK